MKRILLFSLSIVFLSFYTSCKKDTSTTDPNSSNTTNGKIDNSHSTDSSFYYLTENKPLTFTANGVSKTYVASIIYWHTASAVAVSASASYLSFWFAITAKDSMNSSNQVSITGYSNAPFTAKTYTNTNLTITNYTTSPVYIMGIYQDVPSSSSDVISYFTGYLYNNTTAKIEFTQFTKTPVLGKPSIAGSFSFKGLNTNDASMSVNIDATFNFTLIPRIL